MRPANSVGRQPGGRGGPGGPRFGAQGAPFGQTLGQLIGGRYRLAQVLGAGGEGETFAAVDEDTGNACAVKLFRRADGDAVSRVRLEFERLIGSDHPGVVRALDIGRHEGRLFLVTELVTGDSIASIARIADDSVRGACLARAAIELADALAYLHGRGVVHGDVSPGNVRIGADGRCILIDLGAHSLSTTTGGATGTLGFAAPEALIGQLTPAGDLFGLGATLFYAWTGSGPFGEGADAVVRMLSSPAPSLSARRGGLSEAWDRVLAGLLEREPEKRWASARVALREIARLQDTGPTPGTDLLPPIPFGDPLAGIFVGRESERALLRRELDRLAEGVSGFAAIAVVGPEGSGRRTLIDLALRDLAIAQLGGDGATPPVSVFRGPLSAVVSWLGLTAESAGQSIDDDPVRARQRLFARIAAALEARAAATPLVVALSCGDEERELAAFMAGATTLRRWLVLIATTDPLSRIGALDVAVSPLAPADVHHLIARATGEEPSPAAVARVVAAGGGHAAALAILTRQLIEAMRRGDGDRFSPAQNLALGRLLDDAFAGLAPDVRQLVAEVALGLRDTLDAAEGAPTGESLARQAVGLEDAARAAGWIAGEAPHLRLPSAAHGAAVRRGLARSDLHDLARGVVNRDEPLDPRGMSIRAICLEALGMNRQAALAFRRAADRALAADGQTVGAAGSDLHADGDLSAEARAAAWLDEARRLEPSILDVKQRIFLATALARQGQGAAALTLLDEGSVSPDTRHLAAADRMSLVERKAWLLSRAGDLTGARALLDHALAQPRADVPTALVDLSRARLARVLVSLGCFTEAVAAATPCPDDAVAAALATESAMLAHAYGGDLPAARRWGETRALPPGRASYLAALLDHLAGDLKRALASYRAALPEAEVSGDIHTVAAIALNMGALAAEAGNFDEALVMQDRAIRELGRLGATTELRVALFNAGMLLIEVGDLAGARRVATRLRREAIDDTAVSAASVTYLEAELALRDGNQSRALELFTRASAAAGLQASVGRAAISARAELLARGRRAAEADAILQGLQEQSVDPRASPEVVLGRAKVILAGPTLDREAAIRLATALREDARTAAREGRRPRAWRGHLTAARLLHRAGRLAEASAAVATAKQLFEEIRMSTPIDHQAGIERDEDARFLADLARATSPDPEGGGAGGGARTNRPSRTEDRLRRLLRINKRLNSELRLPRLLELIMDMVIELTDAERGFILLEDEKGELTVKVARNIDQQTLESGAFDLSGSIARQAAAGGVPIVTIDAAGDPRFREALSVSDLHLRSVLAVPLQVKSRTVGTLYVDNRLRKGAFGEDDVQLVLDFSEQAGIAIGNARLLAELRRRERQIEVLNRRLEGELAVRKEELVGMKQELRENREALAIRYDYRNIIGRTPRMLDLFRLLDRLTDTTLPVVIQGESGTGKELVARALHFNGPRRDRPFVSENCAAIPETLLESTLFGAVRGAYTGADHDSRGLFEVADGGTLFLDEVGEMSPAMQGKLLRVLQTGELRRVGGERSRKVDVRVVAATNRDLGRMVEEGRFRQDLFFRLSVAAISLPPLRDRREDIPAIVEHVLGQVATGMKAPSAPKRVTPAALARLAAYRWPGNIRELQNELMRAAAMSDGRDIGVEDLSPRVAGDGETALTTLDDPDSLTLRPRVERLERALLREALSRTGGNQTRAALALGLSRFGLQKKLLRYQMS